MQVSCDYIYNGKTYSRAGLLRVLSQRPVAISTVARNFLRNKMGMNDSEVVIVEGLIDNKALGRFLEDGEILLSSFADDSVLYHEAFHRVFRMYLTPSERQTYVDGFKKRKGYTKLIDKYKTLYPDNTEEENIEEYLADEFSDYMLNNQKLNIDGETKTIFERLINFIRKLLGIKTSDIRKLYAGINRGDFSGKPLDKKYRYNKSADKIQIGSSVYSHDIKNEFIQAVSREFINEVLKQGSIYDFIKNKIPVAIQTKLYEQSFFRVAESLEEDNPILVEDFLEDFDLGPNGYLNTQFKMYIETLIGKFKFDVTKEREDFEATVVDEIEQQQQDEGVGEEGKGRPNDDASPTWTASIEIDPKTNMSKAIKLLLASFENVDSINSLGLYSQVRWTNSFNKIAQHLAGVPTSESLKELSKLKEPWINNLIEYLGGVNPDANVITAEQLRLRNDFIKTFSKTKNTFLLAEIGNDTIKVFDANQNTQQKKKLREWNDSMVIAANSAGSFEGWIKRIQDELLDARNPNDKIYEELLGITVDEDLKNEIMFTQNGQDFYYMSAMRAIATHIVRAVKKNNFSNENLPDWKNLFGVKTFDIEGTMKKIADAQNEYEDVVDLMVFNRNKKLYGISLNTHTTHTINTLNYIADLIDPESSIETKMQIIDKYLPNILNYQTVDLVNGKHVIKSKWLQHIMMGNHINMVIADGIKNQLGDDESLADIDESDLLATTLNLSLRGVNISFKHSDRSTFFAYQMENGVIFDYQNGYSTPTDIVNYLTTVLQDQLSTEVKRANLQNVPMFQYFISKYKDSQLFNLKNISKLDPYSPEAESMIKELVQSNLDSYKAELTKWGILDVDSNVIKGLSQDLLSYHNGDLDLTIAASFANQMLTHLEEMKILLGDFAFFKNADDFYKRMSTTSGTGENPVNDELTNTKIQSMNDVEFEIYSPRTGETETMKYDKTIDGTIKSLTMFEKDNYFLPDATELTEASPIDGELISKFQYGFEWNMLADFADPTPAIKSNIKRLAKEYASNYQKINENDGQSWMNMFFFREYMTRLGTWSQAMENLFRAELQILNAKTFDDIKNISVSMGGEQVKVFDWSNWEKGWFESVHTLKSQYAGFTQAYNDYRNETLQSIENAQNRIRPYTIYKTSYHVLWPSVIHGTNLSQMHYFMLKNNMDVIHMNSANKSGAIDAKAVFKSRQGDLNAKQQLVAEHGLNFYDNDGHFNDSVFDGDIGKQLLDSSSTIAYVDSMKDQVKIGNKEKEEIKGSTQSLKIMLSNLIVNGQERFPGANEIVSNYKNVIKNLVEKSIDELLNELGATSEGVQKFETLVNVIKRAAEDRSSPVNIIEAIEGFLQDSFIESLPNKNKIENIFFSIITNNVISFNRPGNSYPQVAATGFEKLGSRKVNEDMSISSSEAVNFYSIEKDEAGNIIKVNPAELIIPLPKGWIPEILKRAKTNNVAEALEWVNAKLADKSLVITVKGVRIPNQQLSSNDILTIKSFTLPTNANFVVVPSGLVTKTGGDFDIDKLNIYWSDSENMFLNNDIKYNPARMNSYSKAELYNILLQIEKQILLHPRNTHMLLMPVIDDLLKQEAFKEIVIDAKSGSRDSTTFLQALTPQKNVEKAIHFIKSKLGVGQVALDITGHSVFMSDHIDVSPSYFNPANEFKATSTSLMFEGLDNNYSLSAMYDAKNRIISEIQSQTMNSQVDAGKDPYAVMLGINNQTLGIMMYLVRRGVPVIQALKFLSQPMIEQYLINQRKNESIINKQRGDELSKKELISLLYSSNGLVQPALLDRSNTFNEEQLEEGIKRGVIDSRQIPMFEYFMSLVDEVSAFNDLKSGMTVDTKGKKDKSAVESFEALWVKINKTQIINPANLAKLKESSVLSPFFVAQELYRKLYFPFYALESSSFGPALKAFKDMVSERQKGALKKERVRSTIDNDFLVFLIQNFNDDFNVSTFNKLFGFTTGEQSLARQIKDLAPNSTNPVIKALFPLIYINKDDVENKMSDALRLFERELSTIDLNDFIDAMKDIRDEISEELYKSIIQLGIYQAGFNNSPFSLNKIFPTFRSSSRDSKGNLTDFQNDYLREIQIGVLNKLPEIQVEHEQLFTQFQDLFYRNNTDYLPKRYNSYSPIKYFFTWSKATQKRTLFYKEDQKTSPVYITQLGGTYYKRYFTEFASGLNTPQVVEETVPLEMENEQPTNGRVTKVISGGQTGIDRLGLEVAESLGIQTGGTATPGFITESGADLTLRDRFKLTEISSDLQRGKTGKEFYPPRTEQNVLNSDGTVYFATDEDSAGKVATERFAKQHRKPFLLNPSAQQLKAWMFQNNISVLNVAGNRGSKVSPEQLAAYRNILREALNTPYNIQLSLFDAAEENSRQLQIPTSNEETIGGSNEASDTITENQTNGSNSIKEKVLEEFDTLFPDLTHYNLEQRNIIASQVESGDIQITCNF